VARTPAASTSTVVRNATLEIEGGRGDYIVRDGQWDV
jgi:hypothetical protein